MRKITEWIKRNKLLAAAAGLGGGILFLSKAGGESVSGSSADDATITRGLITPVTGSPSEDSELPNDSEGEFPPEAGFPPEPEFPAEPPLPLEPEPAAIPEPAFEPEVSTAAPVAAAAGGLTIAGKDFPGATGRTQTGSGKNEFGSYSIWRITFPGRTETWWHYYSGSANGKWTGPHNGNVTSANPSGSGSAGKPPAGPEQPKLEPNVFYNADRKLRYIIKDNGSQGKHRYYESKLNRGDWGGGGVIYIEGSKPQPKPAPAPSAPRPSGGGSSGGGGGSSSAPQPNLGPNIFYNSDRKLRYIIQKHSNKKNYRHYESRLNKGDWGSSAGPGVIPA